MPLSEFLRKRLQAYADNTIPTLLIAGGSFVVGWVIQGYGPALGLDLKVANVLAWLGALIVAIALSALLKPKNKPDQLEPSLKQQLAPPHESPTIIISPTISPVFNKNPQVEIRGVTPPFT